MEEEAFLLGCCPWERASWGCSRARPQAEGRKASGRPGLWRNKGPLLEGRLLWVTELPLAPGPSQKGFNRALPDPFLPVGGGHAGAGLPACSQLAHRSSKARPGFQLPAGGLTGILSSPSSPYLPAPEPQGFSSGYKAVPCPQHLTAGARNQEFLLRALSPPRTLSQSPRIVICTPEPCPAAAAQALDHTRL